MSWFEFFAKGVPKGQPRPRAFARKMGEKFVARVYDAGTAEGWKQAVAMAWHESGSVSLNGPIYVELEFFMPRPKSHFNSKGELKPFAPKDYISKPDCDNLAKAVLDALTQIGAWKDDSQITRITIEKTYDNIGEPGLTVWAKEI